MVPLPLPSFAPLSRLGLLGTDRLGISFCLPSFQWARDKWTDRVEANIDQTLADRASSLMRAGPFAFLARYPRPRPLKCV